MSKLYGTVPGDLGFVDVDHKEMMFWLYLPVKLPGQLKLTVPYNLQPFLPILYAVKHDIEKMRFVRSYLYITVKTLFVSRDCNSNRPGFHSDGFMTNDLNYIWYDKVPTEFWCPDELITITQDHRESMLEMDLAAQNGPFETFHNKHLLKLDERVVHRCAPITAPCVRTFVKVSVSDKIYNLEGNSINHELCTKWDYIPRSKDRNCPIGNNYY